MAGGAAAALLDELMGRDRNLAPSEQRNEIKWNDPEVCKYFLCSFCPHELFVNTRADLGPCDKVHDDIYRKEYQKSSRFERMGYEEEFMRFLQSLISDVEKRIRRGHQRLALNNTQGSLNGSVPGQKDDKIEMLTEKINELVNQAEELGCEGKVEEAQGVMKLCDQLREERRQLENHNADTELPQLKQMEVCDICAAFLIVGDMPQRHDEHLLGKQHAGYAQVRAQVEKMKNEPGQFYQDPEKTLEVCGCCSALLVVGDAQQRIDEHLMGKQHMGYARIRAFLEEQKQKKSQTEMDEKEAREAKLIKEREDREKEREKEREERRKKEKEHEEERRKEREKERQKERDKQKEKRRRRSHSRSRSRRSRSRDRRSRSRDRRRSSSRDRKRRSRSRSRHRNRSKSRDRHKSSRHRTRSRSRDRRSHSRDRRSKSRGHRSHSRDHRSRRSRSRDHSSRKRSRSHDKNRKSREKGKRSEEKDDTRSSTPGKKSPTPDKHQKEAVENSDSSITKAAPTENHNEAPMEEGNSAPVISEGDSNIAD